VGACPDLEPVLRGQSVRSLALDRALARLVLRTLLPARRLAAADAVKVALEYTPQDGPGWLGERPQQPTQVDAAFIVWRDERSVGYLLVGVKLREWGFGACRGAARPSAGAHGNPHPDRRRSLAQIMAEPQRQCWLVETERRRYWRYICDESGLFRFDRLDSGAACPFLWRALSADAEPRSRPCARSGGRCGLDRRLALHPPRKRCRRHARRGGRGSLQRASRIQIAAAIEGRAPQSSSAGVDRCRGDSLTPPGRLGRVAPRALPTLMARLSPQRPW
jgi:hypothetical protein